MNDIKSKTIAIVISLALAGSVQANPQGASTVHLNSGAQSGVTLGTDSGGGVGLGSLGTDRGGRASPDQDGENLLTALLETLMRITYRCQN